MPTIQQVREFSKSRDRIAKPAQREFDRLARAVDMTAANALDQLQAIAAAVMDSYGMAAAELGAQWFEFCAGSSVEGIELAIASSKGALQSNVAYNHARFVEGAVSRETAITSMSAKALEAVISSADETIYENVARFTRDGTFPESSLFIRVAQPGACAFCQMVASNEYTFSAIEKAGFSSHDGCRCVGAPFSGLGDVKGYDPSIYRDRYDEAAKTVRSKDMDEELQARIAAAKEQHEKTSDKPWTSTNDVLVTMRYQNNLK